MAAKGHARHPSSRGNNNNKSSMPVKPLSDKEWRRLAPHAQRAIAQSNPSRVPSGARV